MSPVVPRNLRRLLVVAFIGGTLGGLLVRTFFPQLDALTKVLQIIGPLSGAFLFGWGWNQLNPQGLDERQQQVRYDVYLRSFLVLAMVVLVVPVLMIILYLVSEPTARNVIATLTNSLQGPMDFVWAAFALIPLVGLLPWAMLAWLQPDPRGDDSVQGTN